MKQLRELQGGYPRRMNYLLNVQNELLTVANSMFGKLNQDMVLSGCDIVDNGNGTVNIGPGIVFVSGEVVRFDGAANITTDLTKAFVKDAPVNTDPKVFADGNAKAVYTEIKAIIGDNTSVRQIAVRTELYTLATYITDVAASYAVKGEYKEIYDFDGTFLANFDGTGLGVTARYTDWALDNGNNGTPGTVGHVLIGAGMYTDPVTGLQTNFPLGTKVGALRHTLTVLELPSMRFNYKGWGPYQGNKNGDNNGPDHDNQDFKWQTMQSDPIGGGQSHNIMQPSAAIYRIIKIR